jgi:hypothetical protein
LISLVVMPAQFLHNIGLACMLLPLSAIAAKTSRPHPLGRSARMISSLYFEVIQC